MDSTNHSIAYKVSHLTVACELMFYCLCQNGIALHALKLLKITKMFEKAHAAVAPTLQLVSLEKYSKFAIRFIMYSCQANTRSIRPRTCTFTSHLTFVAS